MNKPHKWLKDAIEAAYEGLTAWPVDNTSGVGETGYNPPYAIYTRDGTELEETLNREPGDPAPASSFPPKALFTVVVYADLHVTAWDIANAIIAAVHGFRGEASGEEVEATVLDARDGGVDYLEGREQPVYTIDIPVQIYYGT